jgi:tetratricopeptide (TPR) repeat protein
MSGFRTSLVEWRVAWMASPAYNLRVVDWGRAASESIAAAFEPSWVAETSTRTDFLRLGFALYDVERYDDARSVFAQFRAESRRANAEETTIALASIWEAHMLDLLGRRSEAVALYQEVVDRDLQYTWSHGQYGMRYDLSPYAAERLDTPFQRIENRER